MYAASVARRHAAEQPVGERDDRVEVRARDRTEREDQRDSPAPVAVEFSSSCKPVLPGESRCAAIPEPTTIATRNAVPTASALDAPAPGRDRTRRQQQRAADSGALAQHSRVGIGLDGAQLAGGHLGVGEHGVDLPRLAVGAVDPDLVLQRRSNTRPRPRSRWRDPRPPGAVARRRPRRCSSTSTPRWLSVPGSP